MDEDEEELQGDLTAHPPEDDDQDINSASPSTSSISEDNPNKDSSSNAVEVNANISTTTTISVSSSSSAIPPSTTAPNVSAAETAPPATGSSPDHQCQRISDVPLAAPAAGAAEEKKPPALDDSRRLFQRLWTDEDEIGLLQGFLEYTMQRGAHNSSHHHDTAPFYDQIKTRLQLDFNKSQLVEKLRRLKKKYRNVLSRISSGKEFSFKSPHDQATFEICRKIWSGTGGTVAVGVEEAAAISEDEEGNPNPASNNTINTNSNENLHNNNNSSVDANNSDKKMSRSRRRSRKRAAEDELPNYHGQTTSSNSIPNVIEDTVRSCLSPLFKELVYCAMGGPCSVGGYGGLALNPLPLSFGAKNSSLNFLGGEMVDEKWRKQQILELEVYSKRIELVQDQIKSALEELRSIGG
ncbi:probable transcription factor At3g04930 [Telopea speciosissima]|uniref:probable transcription factor At3g04930 n=1 Tax=Telopea speciosissima TaxID=54955 RepID=UPI001CC472AD|nr:probable transcription factor At3g04930 [Telopea speciosissima]